MRPLAALLAICLLGACAQTDPPPANGAYPRLLPLEDILPPETQAEDDPAAALAARAAALRARANRLRAPVIDEPPPQPAGTAAP